MNGPENYAEAVLLLTSDPCEYGCPHSGCPHELRLIARAQVHATLALAAATAMNHPDGGMDPGDFEAWRAVCGAPPAADVTP